MSEKIKPLDNTGLKTTSLFTRKSLVDVADFGRAFAPGGGFSQFLESLPNILAGRDLRLAASAIARAKREGKTLIWAMGAHLIKVGLQPVLARLLEEGVISLLAVNGAAAIHDVEIALCGKTSEDVSENLKNRTYGMTGETADFLSQVLERCKTGGMGLGEAVGLAIREAGLPFAGHSLFAEAHRIGVPVTVHVALGTDVWHVHPGFDPGAAGEASHRDFLLFSGAVAGLSGGVHVNAGSAVIMPEVFLKALALAGNLGHDMKDFTAINIDFALQYRPQTNVVSRPVEKGGLGINLTGCHEVLVPLLAAAVLEELHS
ncbi:MAG: hypothetical protein HZB23_04990 [Deltaproteobacteria bacterium]|nr:hypothetical protein [Deltaproteobacteria bacterium]